MTKLVCVLRSGGDFDDAWPRRLHASAQCYAPGTDFWCFTDHVVPGVESLPLGYPPWPRWWSKISLFHPALDLGGVRYLYVDLDTLIIGDLTDLLGYQGEFAMINAFYRPKLAQSGVMAWTPGPKSRAVWDAFMADPEGIMRRFRGDGEFIRSVVPDADRLQDLYPGQIVSLKAHARKGPPEGARLVCGHGRPRFSDPAAGWAHDYWRGA